MQDMKRTLNEHLQRYSREFRRRNPEIKEQVAKVRTAVSNADEIDATFVREHQLIQILLHGCYTKQSPIVTASLQAFHFLVQQRLLVSSDLQLVVQVLSELTDSNMRLPEIGATSLQCCLSDDALIGSSLAKAISVCLRQQCPVWDMHRVVAVIIDRTVVTTEAPEDDDASSLLSVNVEAPPPVHSMDIILADAFGLLQDMVSLAGHRRRLHWLHRVRKTPLVLTLDLLAYTLTHHPTLFLRNRYFEKLLKRRIIPLVATSMDALSTGRPGTENIVENAEDAVSMLDSPSSSDSGSVTPTEEEEDTGPSEGPDGLFLRLVVLTERLIRHYGPIERFRNACSHLLEHLLRGLPASGRHEKAMILRAWSGLLSSCVASWTDLNAVDDILFPTYLTEIIPWLCRELHACLRGAEIRRNSTLDGIIYPEDSVVAFRKGLSEARVREVTMKTEVVWTSVVQEVSFDAAQYLSIILATTKSLLVSLNARIAEKQTGEHHLLLVGNVCSGLIGVLGEMVRRCVDRRTDQTLILAMETTLELAGRTKHPEICLTVIQIHTNLIHRCLTRLQTLVSSTDFVPRDSPGDISYRVAQFGVGLLHLASTFSPYIEDSWSDVVDVIFRLMRLFDFPFFNATLQYDYRPAVELSDSTMASMVSLVCEETFDVRRDLEHELDTFFSKSSFYPHPVLRRILHALFSTMLDKIGEGRSQESKEEFDARLHFTIAKVTELAIHNLERFHTFGAEWLSDFVGLFFVTVTSDVRPARQCFFTIVSRILENLDAGGGEQDSVVEEALVGALYHFELADRPELMRLQIGCLHRLTDRYAAPLPENPYHKSLVAIPDLLRRHCTLPDRENVEAAFGVFQDFGSSPGLNCDPEISRQCCERCLHLGLSFLSQRLCPTTAAATPATLRHIYSAMREADLDCLESLQLVLLDHTAKLEAFSRDERPDVRRGTTRLLFDVLSGKELRSSAAVFTKLVEEVLIPGLAAVLADVGAGKDKDTIKDHADYVDSAVELLLYRCIQEGVRLNGNLWGQLMELIRSGCKCNEQTVAFSSLLSLQNLSYGVAEAAANELDEVDQSCDKEAMKTVRRRLWRLAVEMAKNAVEGDVPEPLLPDSLLLLQANFLAELLALDRCEKKEVIEVVVGLIRHRSHSPESSSTDIQDRKERCLLSLVAAISDALLQSGNEEDESDACMLLHLLANLPFEEDEEEEVTWPSIHLQSHQRQAFILLKEVASARVEAGVHQNRWLTRCLQICNKAVKRQYLCKNLGNWQAAHGCLAFTLVILSRPRLSLGDSESQLQLGKEYEAALHNFLFTHAKDSRHVTAADFLEHQKLELETLGKVRDFIAARPLVDDLGPLRCHITRSFLEHLSSLRRAGDVLLSSTNTGPSLEGEFCDSRQWRFQAACIDALVTLVNWWLELPKGVIKEDDMDVLTIFQNYAVDVLVDFKERLETRGGEPLSSVMYFEIGAIVQTIKVMLNVVQLDSRRRECVVELYPYLVDVILYCNGKVLASILDVLHAYKAIMQPGDILCK